jgi:hypothetical protein
MQYLTDLTVTELCSQWLLPFKLVLDLPTVAAASLGTSPNQTHLVWSSGTAVNISSPHLGIDGRVKMALLLSPSFTLIVPTIGSSVLCVWIITMTRIMLQG